MRKIAPFQTTKKKLTLVTMKKNVMISFHVHSCSLIFFGWDATFTTRRFVNVVIDLPVGTSTTYTLLIVEEGRALQLTVECPQAMVSVATLHRHVLKPDVGAKLSRDHTMIGACVRALKAARPDGVSPIELKAKIHLPVKVASDIAHDFLLFKRGGEVLYVKLKTASDCYSGVVTPKKAVVIEDDSEEDGVDGEGHGEGSGDSFIDKIMESYVTNSSVVSRGI